MIKKIMLKIEGMECPNCSMILERIEGKLKGVLFAQASYHKAQMVLEYDETQVSEDQIQSAIQHMGYQVASISATQK